MRKIACVKIKKQQISSVKTIIIAQIVDKWYNLVMKENIATKLKNLPDEPGVYLMYDADGNVLYVGKAKVLKNRVRQYFHNQDTRENVLAMLTHVDDFQYVITASEADALSLENTLIKKYTPPYNVLLKDGKQYPYVKVNLKDDFPRFTSTRKLVRDGAKYFGPITVGGAKSFLDILSICYPTATCNLNFYKLPKNFRPCLNYHIGRCPAPCVNKISREDYMQVVKNAVEFLKGNNDEVKRTLTQKMWDASEKMQYEEALKLKRYVELIDKLNSKQVVALGKDVDFDVFSAVSNGKNTAVNHTMVRSGKVVYSNNFAVTDAGIDEAQTLSSFLAEYVENAEISADVCTNLQLSDADALAEYISKVVGKTVSVTCPKRADKKRVTEMSERNALEYLTASQTEMDKKFNATQGAVMQLKSLLGLTKMPNRIECYDISNVSGVDKVSSMVVFTSGQKDASQYRRFKIKTVEGANDFASMKETLLRRFERMKNDDGVFGKTPDLIVVDGGLGQLEYARQAMEESGVKVELVSLAERFELVYRLGSHEPVALPRNSYALNLLTNIRDEAHRFAITYFRKLHNKNALKSVLDDIEGVGEKRKTALHKKFKTMDALASATVDEIASTPSVTRDVAKKVYDWLHKN